MKTPEWRPALQAAHDAALDWLEHLPDRPIRPDRTYGEMVGAFSGPLPEAGEPPEEVIASLSETAAPGLNAMNHARFFGYVIGGVTPAGVGAEWLTAAWDQNTGAGDPTPATSAIEAVTAGWILELLDLPRTAAVGFPTGAQMANFVCLAAARERVLSEADWDVLTNGLIGAPAVNVVVGEYVHSTVPRALRLLGLGEGRSIRVEADANARMRPDALRRVLAGLHGPTIVCAQGGEVNTGGIDRLAEIADAVEEHARSNPSWLHVDGAIGLFGRASAKLRPLFAGAERADSWTTDAHKWLNSPYDCGIAIVADPPALRRAMALHAEYLPPAGAARDPWDFNPEASRRARATAVYATIRELGRAGIAEMVERDCAMARRIADGLGAIPGAELLNEVELNQVLVRFRDPAGVDDDVHTHAVLARVQAEGRAYPTPTTWQGRAAIRLSVCNWSIEESDADVTVAALAEAHRAVAADTIPA